MATRILVTDDEPDLEPLILQKFRKRIRDGELEFFFARNGEEALTKLAGDPLIDIVFTDINMPVMDGLTLLLRMGALDRHLKTVVVSAYDDLQNIRTAMNRGAFDFLTKPIDFRDFDVTLRRTVDELTAIRQAARHREQLVAIRSELDVASRIQQAILQNQFPLHAGFEIFAKMLPARSVGGDFYDFFHLDADHLAIAIGDVSGKGVPAALYMAVSRTLVRATAMRHMTPLECLEHVNEALIGQSEGDIFVTLLYGVLDLETRQLDYAMAGHAPPWLLRKDGGIEVLRDTRGTMLGIFEEPSIGTARIQMARGDSLFLLTDGVLDAENVAGQDYSERRLRQALAEGLGGPAKHLVDTVIASVTAFSEGARRNDDITALAVRLT